MTPVARDSRDTATAGPRPGPGRTTFVVGRRTARTSEVHWVRPDPSVFPGPWDLRAVVRRGSPGSEPEDRPAP